MGAPKTAPLREQVISEITAAPGWNKADATALVDALIAEVSAPTPPDALREALEDLTGVAAATLPLVSPSHPLRQAVANARAALEEADRD